MNTKSNLDHRQSENSGNKLKSLYAIFDIDKNKRADKISIKPLEECILNISLSELEIAAVKGGVIYLENCSESPINYRFKFTLTEDFKIPFVEIGNYKNLTISADEFRDRLIFLKNDLLIELQDDLKFGKFLAIKYPGLTIQELDLVDARLSKTFQ
jgi:hypothetical protein